MAIFIRLAMKLKRREKLANGLIIISSGELSERGRTAI
jgi:hypothetical protein